MEKNESLRSVMAWSVHFFTASGICVLFLALIAAVEMNIAKSFLYLCTATVIDAVDGTLSRVANVTTYGNKIDGGLLDNIIDYAGFVLIPAFIVYQLEMIPGFWGLVACFVILLSSCYQFCQVDAKTEDHYFRGFPSYWNIVVLYLFLYQTGPVFNFLILFLCAVLVFVPVKYVYPSRTRYHKKLMLGLSTVWGVGIFYVLFRGLEQMPVWFSLVSTGMLIVYVGASLMATFRPDRV